ncbi:hypothetical protein [Horticoccus sp. 23ND18S-11]|uniref:hypothetical protein n=1 Tax=Horticoccus sp. 23ND18S-11 TaxID=3391832 RepID=UPI0039C9E583
MLPPLRFLRAFALCLVLPVVAALAASAGRVIPAGALIVNEDNSHFFGSRPAEEMTRAQLIAWMDQYAGTAVTHLFLSPNSMRASFRSRTREAIWDPVSGVAPKGLWPENAKRLHDAGLDPYAVWIARARERGLSPWLSMRMNDVHSVDAPDSFMHSEFWRSHPELRRVPGGPIQPWTNHALNYAHAAVRAHHAAFLQELFERYDPDGIELDWMRFPLHLTPGREREEAPLLDAFVRDARRLADEWGRRRGHPIRLGVRVTAHPDAAAGLGLDAVRWAREGWIDLIVPCPFWRTSDFDIPLEVWRERLGPAAATVAVVPGFEHNLRAWLSGVTGPNDLATLRGFAAGAQHRGAESLYLFNWMDSQTRPVSAEDYAELLRTGLKPAAVAGRFQRYPVTYRDTVPPGFPDGTQLPVELGRDATFRVYAGSHDAPGAVGVAIGLAERTGVAAATIAVTLNDRPLQAGADLPQPKSFGGSARVLTFTGSPADVRAGYNTIAVRAGAGAGAQQIVWVELRLNEPQGGTR